MFILREYLDDLKIMVNTDSNSYDPLGLAKITEVVEKIAIRFGFYVKRHHTSELSGDYLEISNVKDSAKYDVIMMGHLDTVQAPDFSKEHPYSEDEIFAYGPGVSDMKSGALCMLYSLKEYCQKNGNNLSVGLLFNCDEEILSKYTRDLTAQAAKKADYAFVLEQTVERGFYTISRKGSGTYKVKFYGISGHSGYIFDGFSANAIVEMSHWATELHKMNNKDTLFSANVAIVNGGTVSNVVPDYAEMTVNVRVAKKDQYEMFENKLRELSENPIIPGVKTETEIISKNFPMVPVPQMNNYLERVKIVFSKIGQDFNTFSIRGGASDGNTIADAGTICIDSLGPLCCGMHTPNEKVYLDDIAPCIDRLVALMEEIASNK